MTPTVINSTTPVIPVLAAAPTGVPAGYMYYDSVQTAAFLWDGSAWQQLGGGGGSSVWLGGGFRYSTYGSPFTLQPGQVGATYPQWGGSIVDVLLAQVVGGIKPATLHVGGYSGLADRIAIFTVRRNRPADDAWVTIATLSVNLPTNDYWSGSVSIDPADLQNLDWISINFDPTTGGGGSTVGTSLMWSLLT